MSYIKADRVKESSTIVGTGTISLLGAAVGFRTFASQMSVGDTCSYVIANTTGSEWEVGIATYSSANTLTRTTVQSSTNANAVVNFSAGLKDVFISPTAQSVIDYDPVTHQISNASWNGDVVDVSKGGTGVTTATGTGSVVRSTAPTLTTATFAAGTISASAPNTITQTWNNAAVTFSAFTVDVTDNASTSSSSFMDFKVASTSQFKVTKTGQILLGTSGISGLENGKGIHVQDNFILASSLTKSGSRAGLGLNSGGVISWSSNSPTWDIADLIITRDAAATLAQRNGTNPQAFRVYNTYTSASVYERASLSWASNVCTLTTESTTAGAGRNLVISAGNGVTSGAGGNLILQAGIQATSGGDGTVIVQRIAGQTSRLQEWRDSTGTVLVSLTKEGYIGCGNIFPGGVRVGGGTPEANIWKTSLNASGVGELILSAQGYIAFASVNGPADLRSYVDTFIYRDSADTIAQRRSTNPQSFRVYNTYTDASNYERLGITWATNICTIGLAQAGTGSTRNLVIAGANATTGAGGNVTITAGSGSGVGAGGNIILQPGAQGTSGGNGTTIIKASDGTNRVRAYDSGAVAITEFAATNGSAGLTVQVYTNGWSYINSNGVTRFTVGGTSNNILDMYTTNFNSLMYSYTSIAWSMNTPATFSTDQTDYLLAGNNVACKKIHRLATTNAAGNAIHSFKIYNGAWGGHELTIVNVGAYNLTIKHNSVTGTAAWRIFNATGSDIILGPNDKLDLMYDDVNNGSGAAGWRAW